MQNRATIYIETLTMPDGSKLGCPTLGLQSGLKIYSKYTSFQDLSFDTLYEVGSA